MNASAAMALESIQCEETATRYRDAYEALLQKWPLPLESLLLSTRMGMTHVLVNGPAGAPPLMLLHGMRATALVWRPNVEELARHFRVYAVDVIGQGGKSVSNARLRRRSDYANWLCELFDALGIDKCFLVGSSYGGFLALNQASLAPERVAGVVMINPAGVFVSVLPLALPLLWHKLKTALRSSASPRQPADIARYLGKSVVLRPDEREWTELVAIGAGNGTVRRNLAFPSVFTTAELRAIRAPTLLLMGDNDLLYDPIATARTAMQRMPSLQVHILQGAHHIAAMAKPRETNEQIIRFLEKTGRG